MNVPEPALRERVHEICRKRGVPNFFDRFEPDAFFSDGLKLHLDVIRTDPARPTVVFMPGTNAYAMLYGEFLTVLADQGYNIVGFDPRGHGRSQGARGSYTLPELLSDLRSAVAFARSRFGDPVAVAGSSQGGITAFYLAASGDPVACAVCHNLADLNDPAGVRLTRTPLLSRMIRPWVPRLARLFPEWKVPMTAYLDLKREPVRGMGNAWKVLREDPLLVPFVRLKGMASLGNTPLPRPVEQIATPVMVIHGEKDTIFPRDYVEEIYGRLTCRKTFKCYDGLPHYLIVDHVDRILPDVVQWLEETCG